MAPPVVTWEGLQAWTALMRIELEPWEAMAMVRLGQSRAAIEGERISKEAKAKGG